MLDIETTCFDKILPRELSRGIPSSSLDLSRSRTRAISAIGKQWPVGSHIRIRFLSGTQEQRDKVQNVAIEWTRHANLFFEFTNNVEAEIRIDFNLNEGSWSYIGKDNLQISPPHRTMNLRM